MYFSCFDISIEAFDYSRIDEWLSNKEEGANSQPFYHECAIEGVGVGTDKVLVQVGSYSQDDHICEGEPEEAIEFSVGVTYVQEASLEEEEATKCPFDKKWRRDVELLSIAPNYDEIYYGLKQQQAVLTITGAEVLL